jgi:hypothetical protein
LELAPEAVEFELLPALLGVKELLPFIWGFDEDEYFSGDLLLCFLASLLLERLCRFELLF